MLRALEAPFRLTAPPQPARPLRRHHIARVARDEGVDIVDELI